jgi:hypothetical protein
VSGIAMLDGDHPVVLAMVDDGARAGRFDVA